MILKSLKRKFFLAVALLVALVIYLVIINKSLLVSEIDLWLKPKTQLTSLLAEPSASPKQEFRILPLIVKPSPPPLNLSQSWNEFGFTVLKNISHDNHENIVISPLSIAMATSLVSNGASGDTLLNIQKTLNISDQNMTEVNQQVKKLLDNLPADSDELSLKIANSVWYRDGFTLFPEFQKLAHDSYNAQVQSLDFSSTSAPNTINSWVDQNTKGKISKIIDGQIDELTMMYLINAVYLKANWTNSFDPNITHYRPFTSRDAVVKQVMMMKQTQSDFRYAESSEYQAIELPYGKDKRFVMALILPKIDLQAFVAKLNENSWLEIRRQLKPSEGSLILPKFKIAYKQELKEFLQKMGMNNVFSENADFSLLSDLVPLFVSQVLHSAVIEVDETGTVVAAVTSIAVSTMSIREEPKRFLMELNKPFIFVIVDTESEQVLFLGVLNEVE